MSEHFDPLLDLLVKNGVLDQEAVETIREEQRNAAGKTVREIVVDGGYIDEDSLLGMMAAYQGCEVVDLASMELSSDVVNAIPASIARMYNVLCVGVDDTSVTLATSNLVDPRVSDEVTFALSKEVRFVMAREKDLNDRIAQHYGDSSESVTDMLESIGAGMDADESLKGDQHDPLPGRRGPRGRHPHRAVREGLQDPLPRGRRALRGEGAGRLHGPRHHLARQDHGEPQHRRAPHPPGRPHRDHRRGPPRRPPRVVPSHHARRIRRYAYSRPERHVARP